MRIEVLTAIDNNELITYYASMSNSVRNYRKPWNVDAPMLWFIRPIEYYQSITINENHIMCSSF